MAKKENQQKVSIDGKEYIFDDLSENAQAQLLQMRAGLTGLFDFQFHEK